MQPIHLLLATALAAGPLAASAAADQGHGHGHHHAPASAAQDQTDWGVAGDPAAARRTVRITMGDDMRFSPAIVEVGAGETVKFVVRNAGRTLHEMVLGTSEALEQHAELMKKHPGMEHADPWMTHVAPGKTGTLVWTFNRPGQFQFGCLVPGHYQAGMVGQVRVVQHAGHKD